MQCLIMDPPFRDCEISFFSSNSEKLVYVWALASFFRLHSLHSNISTCLIFLMLYHPFSIDRIAAYHDSPAFSIPMISPPSPCSPWILSVCSHQINPKSKHHGFREHSHVKIGSAVVQRWWHITFAPTRSQSRQIHFLYEIQERGDPSI